MSVWIPGWVGARVVYGHPFETMNAETKERLVLSWYQNSATSECKDLIETYTVSYIVVGPQENTVGSAGCVDGLTPVFNYGTVTVYEP